MGEATTRPNCGICDHRHYRYEPHVWPAEPDPAAEIVTHKAPAGDFVTHNGEMAPDDAPAVTHGPMSGAERARRFRERHGDGLREKNRHRMRANRQTKSEIS